MDKVMPSVGFKKLSVDIIRLAADFNNFNKKEAQNLVNSAMQARGITGYTSSIRVLPDPLGGTVSGFPPRPVRLGEGLSDWSSNEPAVGVYLEVPVQWTILDIFGIDLKTVRVFASAGVAQ
jgi:hypothetical protein